MIFKNEQKLVPFNECEVAPETLTSVSECETPLPLPPPHFSHEGLSTTTQNTGEIVLQILSSLKY
jgi:hypothetical protein